MSDLLGLDAGHRRFGQPVRGGLRRGGQRGLGHEGDIPAMRPRASASSVTPVSGTDLYLVTLAAAEGLCGTEEVFGACATPPASPPPTGHGGSKGSCSAWCR